MMHTIAKKTIIAALLVALVLPLCGLSLGFQHTALAADKIYKVNASSGLRMRAGATVDSRVVHTISKGTQVKQIGKKGNWLFVETKNGKRGYCFKDYLTPYKKVDNGSGSDDVKLSGKLYFINSVSKVKVYKSNSTKSRVRGKLNGGTVLKLISYKGNWGYIETYNTGKKGFIQLKYLKKYS